MAVAPNRPPSGIERARLMQMNQSGRNLGVRVVALHAGGVTLLPGAGGGRLDDRTYPNVGWSPASVAARLIWLGRSTDPVQRPIAVDRLTGRTGAPDPTCDPRSAAASPALSVDLPGRLDHDVEPGSQLFVGDRCVEVQLGSQSFEDGAHAHTLLGGEAVPVVVSVIADVCVEGFPTVVVRHLVPFMFLMRRVTASSSCNVAEAASGL